MLVYLIIIMIKLYPIILSYLDDIDKIKLYSIEFFKIIYDP